MSKTVIVVMAVALAIAAGAAGFWLGRDPRPDNALAAPAAPQVSSSVVVEATKVSRVALPQGITAVGSLRSDESVTLRPEVAGRINAIHFREGERVSKGTLLVRLDPSVAAAEVEQARANLTLAKQKHARALDLEKKGFIS